MNWLALDIGGANLKAADGRGFGLSRFFPLWQQPDGLADALADLIAAAPNCDALAVTMTGELADCFATKADGVVAILDAVAQAAGGRAVHVYLTDGSLVDTEAAAARPLEAAASNWHALARLAARYVHEPLGLLLDVGSTTCDIIPLVDGQPAARGRTDPLRLAGGELVYTGVRRSPVCAIVDRLPWRGGLCPVAQELFATSGDAYLLTGDLPEEPDNRATADGRPATREAAYDRLVRMICADREMVDLPGAEAMARAIAETQTELLARCVGQMLQRLPAWETTFVISGAGEFLARRVIERLQVAGKVVSLGEALGPKLSVVAPAHALAVIAMEAFTP